MKINNLLLLSTTMLTATCCEATPIENPNNNGNGQIEKPDENEEVFVDTDRPNIVLIMADDLLSAQLSCYGGVNINTPNIDRLAAEGVMFRHNFASMAASVPIRAAMYTGLYPVRNGAYQNQKATYTTTKSVADFLPACNYRVGRAGKSHFKSWTTNKIEQLPGFMQDCTKSKVNSFDVSGIKEFMTRSEDPFMLYVCSTHPHTPWDSGNASEFKKDQIVLPDFLGDTDKTRELFCNYLAEIRLLDNQVGGVYKALEDCGKLDNTLILFLGEQGLEMPGGKYTVWHPGVQSAMIARYPEKIEEGSTCDAIVQYEDILPTMIDIAGGTVETGQFDGKSFKNTLYGRKSEHRDYAFGMWTQCPKANNPFSIRSVRDKDYVLIHNLHYAEYAFHQKGIMNMNHTDQTHYSKVWVSWKAVENTNPEIKFLCTRYTTRPEFEFYDLKNDPAELHNLYGDSKYAERIITMRTKMDEWMKQQKDPGKVLDVRGTPFSGWEY